MDHSLSDHPGMLSDTKSSLPLGIACSEVQKRHSTVSLDMECSQIEHTEDTLLLEDNLECSNIGNSQMSRISDDKNLNPGMADAAIPQATQLHEDMFFSHLQFGCFDHQTISTTSLDPHRCVNDESTVCLDHLPSVNESTICLDHLPSVNESTICLDHLPSVNESTICLDHLPSVNESTICLDHLPSVNESTICLDHLPSVNERTICLDHLPSVNESTVCLDHLPSVNESTICLDHLPSVNESTICLDHLPSVNESTICLDHLPSVNDESTICLDHLPSVNESTICLDHLPSVNDEITICLDHLPSVNDEITICPDLPSVNDEITICPDLPSVNDESTICLDNVPSVNDDEITICPDNVPSVNDESTMCLDNVPSVNDDEITIYLDNVPSVNDESTMCLDNVPSVNDESTICLDNVPSVNDDEITIYLDNVPSVKDESTICLDNVPSVNDEITICPDLPSVNDESTICLDLQRSVNDESMTSLDLECIDVDDDDESCASPPNHAPDSGCQTVHNDAADLSTEHQESESDTRSLDNSIIREIPLVNKIIEVSNENSACDAVVQSTGGVAQTSSKSVSPEFRAKIRKARGRKKELVNTQISCKKNKCASSTIPPYVVLERLTEKQMESRSRFENVSQCSAVCRRTTLQLMCNLGFTGCSKLYRDRTTRLWLAQQVHVNMDHTYSCTKKKQAHIKSVAILSSKPKLKRRKKRRTKIKEVKGISKVAKSVVKRVNSSEAPVNTIPVNMIPVNTVPVNTIPVNTIPVNTKVLKFTKLDKNNLCRNRAVSQPPLMVGESSTQEESDQDSVADIPPDPQHNAVLDDTNVAVCMPLKDDANDLASKPNDQTVLECNTTSNNKIRTDNSTKLIEKNESEYPALKAQLSSKTKHNIDLPTDLNNDRMSSLSNSLVSTIEHPFGEKRPGMYKNVITDGTGKSYVRDMHRKMVQPEKSDVEYDNCPPVRTKQAAPTVLFDSPSNKPVAHGVMANVPIQPPHPPITSSNDTKYTSVFNTSSNIKQGSATQTDVIFSPPVCHIPTDVMKTVYTAPRATELEIQANRKQDPKQRYALCVLNKKSYLVPLSKGETISMTESNGIVKRLMSHVAARSKPLTHSRSLLTQPYSSSPYTVSPTVTHSRVPCPTQTTSTPIVTSLQSVNKTTFPSSTGRSSSSLENTSVDVPNPTDDKSDETKYVKLNTTLGLTVGPEGRCSPQQESMECHSDQHMDSFNGSGDEILDNRTHVNILTKSVSINKMCVESVGPCLFDNSPQVSVFNEPMH